MNWDQVKGNWKQVQGKVKQQWAKLTDDDLLLIEGEIAHPVRLDLEKKFQMFAGRVNKIAGIIVGRKRIRLSAFTVEIFPPCVDGKLLCPFKHHVFKKMRKPRASHGFVFRANPKPCVHAHFWHRRIWM